MTAFEILKLTEAQIKRRCPAIKTAIAPSSIHEKGVVARLSVKKIKDANLRPFANKTVELRLAVTGTAESQKGLELATSAIEALDAYFTQNTLYLEDVEGKPIPNTRIRQSKSEDDALLDNPYETSVQEVYDERILSVQIGG
nr:MAG TPA: hypothetical protein [Bacteriophage sp.]